MLIEKILNTLLDMGEASTKVFFSGYAESYRRMRGIYREEKIDWEKIERRRFIALVSKLKSEGFIQKKRDKDTDSVIWSITKKGVEKLRALARKKEHGLPKSVFPKISPTGKQDHLKVVVFDIPESKRKIRDWLRRTLSNLEFEKLQKSVWVGNEKLPAEFFQRLKEFKILPYVHIFAVSKKGSLNIE